jgi:hypothetical protein
MLVGRFVQLWLEPREPGTAAIRHTARVASTIGWSAEIVVESSVGCHRRTSGGFDVVSRPWNRLVAGAVS